LPPGAAPAALEPPDGIYGSYGGWFVALDAILTAYVGSDGLMV
jgi:hypothetical protein